MQQTASEAPPAAKTSDEDVILACLAVAYELLDIPTLATAFKRQRAAHTIEPLGALTRERIGALIAGRGDADAEVAGATASRRG